MHARRLNELTLDADWSLRPRGCVTLRLLVLYALPVFKGYQCYVFPQNVRILVILLCGKDVSPRVQFFKKSALESIPLHKTKAREHVHKFGVIILNRDTTGSIDVRAVAHPCQ